MPKPSLEVGTIVYYPPHGVGSVTDFGKETIGSETFPVIWLVFTRKRIAIPERNSDQLVRPEEFASKKVIDQIPSILRGRSLRRKRGVWKTQFDSAGKKVRSNNFADLIQGIRDLAQLKELPTGYHYSPSEIELLRDAVKRLRDLLFLVAPERAEKILNEADAIFKEHGFLPLSEF
jgi:RNA polymerase-interacting CarD/CdnL/TRCF family regulator